MLFLKKFGYAFQGIRWVTASQSNFRFHLVAAAAVIGAGFYFWVEPWEWVALILCMAMVLAAETFNSAIEWLVDKVSPGWDEKAGKIKDMSAAAVLISAIAAAIIGGIIFLPKIMALLNMIKINP